MLAAPQVRGGLVCVTFVNPSWAAPLGALRHWWHLERKSQDPGVLKLDDAKLFLQRSRSVRSCDDVQQAASPTSRNSKLLGLAAIPHWVSAAGSQDHPPSTLSHE